MNTNNVYLAIKIIAAYVIIKLLLLFLGIDHFYNVRAKDKTSLYIRDFLEDITLIGFIILFVIW
jgi:hypothetical protein